MHAIFQVVLIFCFFYSSLEVSGDQYKILQHQHNASKQAMSKGKPINQMIYLDANQILQNNSQRSR